MMDKCKNCGKSKFHILQMSEAYFINESTPNAIETNLKNIYICGNCYHAFDKKGIEVYSPKKNEYLMKKVQEFLNTPRQEFVDLIRKSKGRSIWRAKADVLLVRGVYGIYENTGRLLYLGKAGGGTHFINARIGDMFCDTPESSPAHHQVTQALLERKEQYFCLEDVHNYYFNECHFKYVVTETENQALELEEELIQQLKPEMNKQVPIRWL